MHILYIIGVVPTIVVATGLIMGNVTFCYLCVQFCVRNTLFYAMKININITKRLVNKN